MRFEDGPVAGRVFVHGARPWRSLLRPLFWLRWLQQGRPRDFPVALVPPTITARGRYVGSTVVTDERAMTDALFSFALVRPGAMSYEHLIDEASRRFDVVITFPDGHQETRRLACDRP